MNKRYVIWDEVSNVITPIGEVLTAEDWMNRYPMARLDGLQLVLAGGQINGAFCGVYSEMVDMYERMGCDFSACTTQQEHLDAIEAFEDERSKPVEDTTISDATRTADALEDLVLLQELQLEAAML